RGRNRTVRRTGPAATPRSTAEARAAPRRQPRRPPGRGRPREGRDSRRRRAGAWVESSRDGLRARRRFLGLRAQHQEQAREERRYGEKRTGSRHGGPGLDQKRAPVEIQDGDRGGRHGERRSGVEHLRGSGPAAPEDRLDLEQEDDRQKEEGRI